MEKDSHTGLALSGGGFRATLFHLGAIWRLNEMALLPEIDTISSVSGGAILAGLLAVKWHRLSFHNGIAANFQEEIVNPIWDFCGRRIDALAVPLGIVSGTWALERSYRRHLVGISQLQDLPSCPDFIFNAAHVETGRNCTLSRVGLHTWRIGDCRIPYLMVAQAMAASSACPPFFPPVTLKVNPDSFTKSEHADLFDRNDLKSNLSLTDGGAYDNLGFHAIRDCKAILVSDAGSPLRATRGKWYARQFNHRIMRPMETAITQTRATRIRTIMDQLTSGEKKGAIWTINTPVDRYPTQSPFQIAPGWDQYLSSVRTRLNAFTAVEKSELVNWGYTLCDLSIRSYYKKGASLPQSLPRPLFDFGSPPST